MKDDNDDDGLQFIVRYTETFFMGVLFFRFRSCLLLSQGVLFTSPVCFKPRRLSGNIFHFTIHSLILITDSLALSDRWL